MSQEGHMPWRVSLDFDEEETDPFRAQSDDQLLLQQVPSLTTDAQQESDWSLATRSPRQLPQKNQDQNRHPDQYSELTGPDSTNSRLVSIETGSRSNHELDQDSTNTKLSQVVTHFSRKPLDDSISRGSTLTPWTVSSIWRTWWLEMLSTLLAFSCMVAILAILYLYDKKRVDQQPTIISINSLISIFSAVMRAALIMPVAEGIGQLKWGWFRRPEKFSDVALFDHASRGPWGSLLFILNKASRINQSFLPCLGAFITIATLAIGPFTQALVEHNTCELEIPFGIARVPRTNNYSAAPYEAKNVSSYYESFVESSMRVAVYRGLLEFTNTSSLIDVQCEKGNCTFGDANETFFSSLAMCHYCKDISDRIVEDPKIKFGFSLPSNDSSSPDLSLNSKTVVDSQGSNLINRTAFNFEALMLRARPGSNDSFGAFAVTCGIIPCIKSYKATVKNKIYSEEETDPKPLDTVQGLHLSFGSNQDGLTGGFSIVTNSTLIEGKSKNCTASETQSKRGPSLVPIDSTTKWSNSFDNSTSNSPVYYPAECVWTMKWSSFLGIRASLFNLLNGTLTTIIDNEWDKFDPQNVRGDIWFKNLFNGGEGDLAAANRLFEGLASSITAEMRNRPYSDDNIALPFAQGKAIDVTTCISVRWHWISFPATLLILQIIFCTTILFARYRVGRDDDRVRGDWKSSPLVLLFHGMEHGLKERLGQVSTAERMEELAEDTHVQLCRVDVGGSRQDWRFCAR